MLIIRRIDVRSFLRTALPALVLVEVPLLLLTMEYAFPSFIPLEWKKYVEGDVSKTVDFMLYVSALNLLYVVAGILFTLWVYNALARHNVALSLILQPDGGALRLRRIGPGRALKIGLLLSGLLAALVLWLTYIPVLPGVGLVGPYFTPLLLELNMVSRLLADFGQFRIGVAMILSGGHLVPNALTWVILSLASALAGGALYWLGATLYNRFVGEGGQFALRLRAARQEKHADSLPFTAQLKGIHLSRARDVSFRVALFLLPILLMEIMWRGPTPAMLFSILRWPLALLLFNRLAPGRGGLLVECELMTPVAA